MKLYNTLTKTIEEFAPGDPANVKIYTCGPTVYNYQHIGNYAAYIYWDTLIRALRTNGYTENRILNITDVGHLTSDADEGEDKLEKGAKREGKSVYQIAEHYTKDFLENYHAFNLIKPTKITKATDYIEADISLIDALTKKGFTYETSDGIYFDTSKFPHYADFARLDLQNLKAGARVEYNSEKKNPSDFALWKFIKPGQDHAMRWDYRGRPGYPGWHIECSAIIHAELGEPIDIHTGGIDHIPIHHTNEIAQSEAAFKKPLSKFWLHNNHITVEGEKISKSLGNAFTPKDLSEKGFTHLDFRMWVLQGHYQSARNFQLSDLTAAKQRLQNYRNYAALRHQNLPTDPKAEQTTLTLLIEYLSDNLNTPQLLSTLDAHISQNSTTAPTTEFIRALDLILGLKLAKSTPDITHEQKQLIASREKAREQKDFNTSDQVRKTLEEQGITLLDNPSGTIWQLL